MANTWIIIQIAGVVIGFIIVYSLLQFLVSIHPPRVYSSKTPLDYGIPYEKVTFTTSDGIALSGWLLSSPRAKATIIIGHGYPFDKGNIFPVTKFLYPQYNLLFYDHRYFGESGGKITTVGLNEVEDVNAAVKFTKKRFPKQPLALYGFSLSAAAMLMAQPPAQAVIADSPYADLERMINHIYFYFGPLKWPFVKITSVLGKIFLKVSPADVSPAKAVAQSTIPMFIIHGAKDSQIPVENAYALKESNPAIELWIVEGADHGQAYALFPEEYQRKIHSFLRKHMK